MSDQLTQDPESVRDAVRERYAVAARSVTGELPQAAACCGSDGESSCCGSEAIITDDQAEVFGSELYGTAERDELPDTAVLASLGCGNPTAVADLHAGETVLDLGSGGGIDVLLSARRVGPTGRAYGLDMTDEMLELARTNQAKAGVEQRRVAQGLHRGHPAARRVRRRRDLQLRHQSLGRQAQGDRRGRPRPASRWALRRLRRDRRRRHGRRHASRHGRVRPAASPAPSPETSSPPPSQVPDSSTSRSSKLTGSTPTPARRSSEPASPLTHA